MGDLNLSFTVLSNVESDLDDQMGTGQDRNNFFEECEVKLVSELSISEDDVHQLRTEVFNTFGLCVLAKNGVVFSFRTANKLVGLFCGTIDRSKTLYLSWSGVTEDEDGSMEWFSSNQCLDLFFNYFRQQGIKRVFLQAKQGTRMLGYVKHSFGVHTNVRKLSEEQVAGYTQFMFNIVEESSNV